MVLKDPALASRAGKFQHKVKFTIRPVPEDVARANSRSTEQLKRRVRKIDPEDHYVD